jgi:hypothetical protein
LCAQIGPSTRSIQHNTHQDKIIHHQKHRIKTIRKNSTARNTKLNDEKQEDKITAKNNSISTNTELNNEKQYDNPPDGITRISQL